ncbi:MAG: DUF2934 domain-containing protein [Candidatus Competibacteraceae bacterium]|nr:DUF2934 domain-containing protein [Candidatus Competibacteraceae bacterium]HRY15206.1 DUF2934 domain-containing protein [Candidatus Competibacteraceae bacterium]
MEHDLEHDIRRLAHDIWRSAGSEFSRTALDFWAMAERMVIEFTADSVRRTNTATAAAVETATNWPLALRALYLYRVRQLAHCMASASTEQRERSLDYWLAAEKHLRLLTESATRAASALGQEEALTQAFETFSPADYLEQIRKTAYHLWETAESQHHSTLDIWLAAESQILESLAAGATFTDSQDAAAPARTAP